MSRRPVSIPEDLVLAAKRNDRSAREELYHRVRPLVMRVLVALLGRAGQLRELCDDVCADVIVSLPEFRGESRFTTWVYAVVVRQVNKRRHAARVERRVREAAEGRPPGDPPPRADDVLAFRELAAAAGDAILRLPPRLAQCVVLIDILGLEPAEAASIVGGTAHSASTSAWRGRMRVVESLVRRGVLEGDDVSRRTARTSASAGNARREPLAGGEEQA